MECTGGKHGTYYFNDKTILIDKMPTIVKYKGDENTLNGWEMQLTILAKYRQHIYLINAWIHNEWKHHKILGKKIETPQRQLENNAKENKPPK